VRIEADAQAYAVEVQAKADAEQTRLLAEAINNDGQPAIDFEIMKRQVVALGQLASAENAKTIVVPSNVTGVLGSLEALMESAKGRG